MSDRASGVAAMGLAGVIWGLSPIYYKGLTHVPALEVASHRVIWSFLTFAVILAVQRRGAEFIHIFSGGRNGFALTVFAAVMISVNWFTWILAVQLGFLTEASFGYFIFPIFAVLLGAIGLRERLTPVQWVSIGIATAAIIYMAVGLNTAPWIALLLATTFAAYGLIKRKTRFGPIHSVAAEAGLITPIALVWLVGTHAFDWVGFTGGSGGIFGSNLTDSLLLAFSGVITAGPLVLMSYATKRLRYADIGLLQYTNPSLQFLVAVFVFMEPFGRVQLTAFILIWAALALYSFELFRQDRRLRSSRMTASGEVTTL